MRLDFVTWTTGNHQLGCGIFSLPCFYLTPGKPSFPWFMRSVLKHLCWSLSPPVTIIHLSSHFIYLFQMKVVFNDLLVLTYINVHSLQMPLIFFDCRFSLGCKGSLPKSQTQYQLMVSTSISLSSVISFSALRIFSSKYQELLNEKCGFP